MTEYTFVEGSSCEISQRLYKPIPTMKRVPVHQNPPYTIPEFHSDLHKAIKGPKYGVIDVLCRFVSSQAGFSDIEKRYPGLWDELQRLRVKSQ